MSQNLKEHQKAVHANIKDKQCEHCYNYTGRRDALKKHLESRRNTFEVSCESHSLSFHSIENIYESEMGGIGDESQKQRHI